MTKVDPILKEKDEEQALALAVKPNVNEINNETKDNM